MSADSTSPPRVGLVESADMPNLTHLERDTHFEPISLLNQIQFCLWSLLLTSEFNVHTNSIYTALMANLTHFTDQRLGMGNGYLDSR